MKREKERESSKKIYNKSKFVHVLSFSLFYISPRASSIIEC